MIKFWPSELLVVISRKWGFFVNQPFFSKAIIWSLEFFEHIFYFFDFLIFWVFNTIITQTKFFFICVYYHLNIILFFFEKKITPTLKKKSGFAAKKYFWVHQNFALKICKNLRNLEKNNFFSSLKKKNPIFFKKNFFFILLQKHVSTCFWGPNYFCTTQPFENQYCLGCSAVMTLSFWARRRMTLIRSPGGALYV